MQDYRRGVLGGAAPRVAAVPVWSVLSYLVLLMMLTLRTSHRGLPGWPPLLLALLALAFLVACTALGWVVGSRSAVRMAAPLLAFAIFLACYFTSYLGGWPSRLSPVDPDSVYRPFLQPHVRLVWIQVGVLVAVTALALAGLIGRRRVRTGACLAAVVLLGAAVLTLAGTDPAPTELRGDPADPACSIAAVEVCVRPENAAALPEAAGALAAASAALGPYLAVPARFGEPGMDRRPDQGPGVFIPPDVPYPGSFPAAAVAAILPAPCPVGAGPSDAYESYDDLVQWAHARISGLAAIPQYAVDRVGPVLALDVPAQREWVRGHLVAACAG